MEIWKDIDGYDGEYQVSNQGRVKSLKSRFGKQPTETIMMLQPEHTGYMRVCLVKNKKPRCIPVHRLVAKTFIPNTENKPIIDHINGNRTDNRVENLRWVTHSENSQNTRYGSARWNSVKVKDNHGHIFDSYREAGRYWGLTGNTVKRDCLGLTKYSKNQQGTDFERKVRFEKI